MEFSGETAVQNTTQCRPQMNDAVEKNQDRSNPSRRDVMSVIPQACFERSLWRSCRHLAMSLTLTIGSGVLAYYFIPMTWAWLPAWILYAIVNGTFATGCWVMAHECGHRGFAKSAWLQDRIGFVLHSALLVPYYSWQRSHALHHARTNDLDQDETFVPPRADSKSGRSCRWWRSRVGDEAFAIYELLTRFTVGWPIYLLTGATGAPSRGVTNHFWPVWPYSTSLFPGKWRGKVWRSDLGVIMVVLLLVWWAIVERSVVPVVAVYVGPYLVVNFWLVLYTWLHHTDVDIPHLESDEWTWGRGVFLTVDRPYGPLLDFLHHRIGSTHVAHHIDGRIPHYHGKVATEAIKKAFPTLYRHDPTPIPKALWRIATECHVVYPTRAGWQYVPEDAVVNEDH